MDVQYILQHEDDRLLVGQQRLVEPGVDGPRPHLEQLRVRRGRGKMQRRKNIGERESKRTI